jgi:trehalose-phosphatase
MLPSALNLIDEIVAGVGGKRLAVFLDYDGTLTPIVSRPENAWLSESMRQALRVLAGRLPVAILSGRDMNDVRRRVNIDGIVYAGSHGFDIAGPGGLRRELGMEYLPELDSAEKELHQAIGGVPGAQLERKRFSIAAHYRNVKDKDLSEVARSVEAVAARHRELRRLDGKKVYELLPDIDWDKGKTMIWLLDTLGLDRKNVRPTYIGDDTTDEDAFRALEHRGIGILVSEQSQPSAATYSLKDPAQVERFLAELIARLSA